MNCVHCGKPLDPTKRKHAKYCSSKCRTYASRQRQRAELVAKSMTMQFDTYAKIEVIQRFAPRTAAGLRDFIQANGLECSSAAIALCLTAINETAGIG